MYASAAAVTYQANSTQLRRYRHLGCLTDTRGRWRTNGCTDALAENERVPLASGPADVHAGARQCGGGVAAAVPPLQARAVPRDC